MHRYLSMALRPSSLIILVGYAAQIVLFSLTLRWYVMITHLEQHVNLNSENVVTQIQSKIEHSARLIHPMNSTSTNLARLLSPTLNVANISFSNIETKLAPLLFQAFETNPYLAQISYIGMEGLFFSFYNDDNDQAMAMYSNSTSSIWGTSNKTLYYIQPINRDTGELHGEAIISNQSINISWIGEVVNSSKGYASLGTKWSNDNDMLFISSASITSKGVISLGFPATTIVDFFNFNSSSGPYETSLYLGTKDGHVLVEGIQHTHVDISNDTVSFHSMNANGDQTSYEGNVSCKDEVVASSLNIQGTDYLIHCSPIDIMGIESVYVLAVPQNRSVSFVKKNGLTLLIVMIVMFFIAMVSFLNTNARASRREMHLCSSLIKQMEATQQAERKRMNKSLAFASASHDIRASLAALIGLIEMSYEDVTRGSELETNLNQMESCTKDLLGLLNSLLDTSKIEAGKMQLEEEEFDIFQLLEDVVDLYHPVAMKKGVDLVLDPCNGSMLRYSRSKGDRGKLKQVLCNLLSNAVKFTDEGHIAVRAWAQKPSLQNSIIADNQHSFMKNLSCLFSWRNEPHDDDPGAWNPIQQDPSCMDFIFEVDDTGKGIPKEKYKSVFENYVQVKETALGQGGTGLGLGIVQSLVRLMHGDIRIVEKDIGEKGTCFRFNVLLSACETGMASGIREVQSGSDDKNQPQCSGSSICSSSPKLRIRSPSSIPEASQVVLLIQDEERRRITQRFVESLGIKVNVVKHAKHLLGSLRKIKQKGSLSSPLSSDLSSQSASCGSTSRSKRIPLSSMDGNDYINSIFKKTDLEAMSGFILIVIDANAGPFSELCRMVYDFKRGLGNPCKVIWLEKPHMRRVNFKDDVFDSNDIVLSKPFHGTRLFRTIELLPEYGGASQCSTTRAKREHGLQVSLTDEHEIQIDEEEKYGNSRSRKETQQSFGDKSYDRSKAGKSPVRQCEIVECVESRTDKPLSGKKFLVVDDTKMLLNIAKTLLERLGASVEQCEDGILAVQQVEEGLKWDSHNPPYDYILMDYEMPGMNGFEATRKIREMEEPYGLRIPIIALTAHTGEEAKKTIEAGMDDCLSKPIKKEALLEAIRKIHGT